MSKIRFYKYYFLNTDKPIIMEAENRKKADQMLVSLKQKINIDLKKIIDIRVETPLFGISEKKRGGVEFVWVGKDYSSDGWIEKEKFDKSYQ